MDGLIEPMIVAHESALMGTAFGNEGMIFVRYTGGYPLLECLPNFQAMNVYLLSNLYEVDRFLSWNIKLCPCLLSLVKQPLDHAQLKSHRKS